MTCPCGASVFCHLEGVTRMGSGDMGDAGEMEGGLGMIVLEAGEHWRGWGSPTLASLMMPIIAVAPVSCEPLPVLGCQQVALLTVCHLGRYSDRATEGYFSASGPDSCPERPEPAPEGGSQSLPPEGDLSAGQLRRCKASSFASSSPFLVQPLS